MYLFIFLFSLWWWWWLTTTNVTQRFQINYGILMILRVCMWILLGLCGFHSIKLFFHSSNQIRCVNAINECGFSFFESTFICVRVCMWVRVQEWLCGWIMMIMWDHVNIYLVRRTSFCTHHNCQNVHSLWTE